MVHTCDLWVQPRALKDLGVMIHTCNHGPWSIPATSGFNPLKDLGIMVHTCNFSTQDMKAEDQKVRVILGDIIEGLEVALDAWGLCKKAEREKERG